LPDAAAVTDTWDPAQYDRYRAERAQPFYDLMRLCRGKKGLRVVDLGCGTGELTRELHRHLKATSTRGIDSSAAMLAASGEHVEPGLSFSHGDIASFPADDERFDLVFSNAALQWVDDHAPLFARLWSAVADGGQLAVQMPANHDAPSHTTATELATEEPYASALAGGARVVPVLAPEAYASLLHRLGAREQHVRLQVYGHRLDRRDDVVEWVKGTLLTDYKKRLPAELYARFEADYRARLIARLDDERPYFFPFKRLLLWASR
jgi:trans-aconitate 2-methyltransferase